MTDTSIIELYFRRSERAINESQASYGGYCYRVADGILRDARDSEESVNDTWLAAWNATLRRARTASRPISVR